MLQTWNAKNVTCKVVQVEPVLTLAPPPSKWIAFLVLNLEVFF